MPEKLKPAVLASGCSETWFMLRTGAWLREIKTFTGKKTLTNAVALFLHILLYDAGGI
jgi:hypothetical protein